MSFTIAIVTEVYESGFVWTLAGNIFHADICKQKIICYVSNIRHKKKKRVLNVFFKFHFQVSYWSITQEINPLREVKCCLERGFQRKTAFKFFTKAKNCTKNYGTDEITRWDDYQMWKNEVFWNIKPVPSWVPSCLVKT